MIGARGILRPRSREPVGVGGRRPFSSTRFSEELVRRLGLLKDFLLLRHAHPK